MYYEMSTLSHFMSSIFKRKNNIRDDADSKTINNDYFMSEPERLKNLNKNNQKKAESDNNIINTNYINNGSIKHSGRLKKDLKSSKIKKIGIAPDITSKGQIYNNSENEKIELKNNDNIKSILVKQINAELVQQDYRTQKQNIHQQQQQQSQLAQSKVKT